MDEFLAMVQSQASKNAALQQTAMQCSERLNGAVNEALMAMMSGGM